MKIRYFLLLGIFLCSFTSLKSGLEITPKDQLILFLDNINPKVDDTYLSKFYQFAEVNEIAGLVRYTDAGIPEGIKVTPSLVYRNYLGHSIYYGRYTNFGRLRNFIRTSRLLHTTPTTTTKKEQFVWRKEQATVTVPLKLTQLTGAIKLSFDQKEFLRCSKEAIDQGMENFMLEKNFVQPPTNRAFYVNLYPHLDDKKSLSITGEIYSQFNCIEPVFKNLEEPLVQGKWKNRAVLFNDAGRLMEEKIIALIEYSEIGDAFQPVSVNNKVRSWSNLDLGEIQQPDPQLANKDKLGVIPRHWIVEDIENTTEPLGAFSFLAPLNGYAGEIKGMEGQLSLNEKSSLTGSTAKFSVQIADITMGDKGFDKEVHYKMLDRENFPKSTFVFEEVLSNDVPLQAGLIHNFEVKGQFMLKGHTIPLTVPAEIMPLLQENGELRLEVRTSFSLDLFANFKIAGPDGPAPARDVLKFYLKFILIPA